jgi:cytochrome c oxidase assembly protein subunit 11
MSPQQQNQAPQTPDSRKNTRVAARAALFACAMLGLAYASVPLYQIFCQTTGFGGTTQRAVKESDTILDRTIVVRFDGNVSSDLAWKFKPVQSKLEVKYGAKSLAFYRATNTSDKPITGTATFNVAPEAAGAYFNKIECFCFTEQTLRPGESVDMPVTFFIDPDMIKDRSARSISQVTLSYTFYPVAEKRAQSVDPKNSQPGPRLMNGLKNGMKRKEPKQAG